MAKFSINLPANTDSGAVSSTSFMDALAHFSVSVWLKISVAMGVQFQIICKRNTGAGGNGWTFYPNTTGGLLSYQADAAYREDATTNAIEDGSWHNVVFAISNSVVAKFYIDGTLASSSTLAGGPQTPGTNTRTVHVGTDTSTLSMPGLHYANIKMWNVTLTQGNATTLAAGGDVAAGQVANWDFSEGSGLTAADSVGGNTLTFSAVTWSSDIPSQLASGGGSPQRMLTGMGL